MTTDSKVELKPCPFCGSNARLWKFPTPQGDYGVECSVKGKACASLPACFLTEEEAVAAWNTRQHEDQADSAFPMGAIENGRGFIARLENNYCFEDDGRPLVSNAEWDELKRCFEYMAEYLLSETGLSPRELAEQREELLGALISLEQTSGLPSMSNDPVRVKARTAIARAKGEPVLAV